MSKRDFFCLAFIAVVGSFVVYCVLLAAGIQGI